MKRGVNYILGVLIRSLNSRYNHQILVISICITIISSFLFLHSRISIQSKINSSVDADVPPIFTVSTAPPTKWWLRATTTSTSDSLNIGIPTGPKEDGPRSKCSSNFSPRLQPGTYAYISLTPPLPNRIRAGAGKANAYLGQIQPGNGVQILGGPVCADDFSWWLVESTKTQLRGWTVMGSGSQQWIIPCPNPNIACEYIPATPQIIPTATFPLAEENIGNRCNSNKFAIGVFAQVAEDNLLAIRSEPYTGSVIGHAGPMSAIRIVDGPACVDSSIWWKVSLTTHDLTGWTTEANLRVCTKENDCS